MAEDQSWVTKRVTEVRAIYPAVTESAASRIQELLIGPLCQFEQTKSQLKGLARELLLANIPKIDAPGLSHEN